MDKDKKEKLTKWSQKTCDYINEMAQDGLSPFEASYVLGDLATRLAVEGGGIAGVAMINGLISEHAEMVIKKQEEQDADSSGDSTETEG